MADSTNPAPPSSEQVPTAPRQADPVTAPTSTPEKKETGPGVSTPQSALSQVEAVLNKAGQALQKSKESAEPQAPTTTTERVWSAFSYIPMVAPISLLMNPASDFVKLHAKQGLMLFIILILTLFLDIMFAPLGFLLATLIKFAMFVVGIYSIYMAFSGNWWKIPFIYQVADKIPVDIFTKITTEAITGQVPSTQAQAPTPVSREEKNQLPPDEPQNLPPTTPASSG